MNTAAECCFTLSILIGEGELNQETFTEVCEDYGLDSTTVNNLIPLAEHSLWVEETGDTVEETYSAIVG